MMIEVIDRIPTHPGRVKLTPVNGQENTFDMVRADAPIVEGTPINKALFDSYYKTLSDMIQAIDNKIFEATQLVTVGSVVDGTLFGVFENNVMVPYIKIGNNYSNTSRTLVVRRDCISQKEISPGTHMLYRDSEIDRWLENEFIATLDPTLRSVLSPVSVGVAVYNGTTSISRKAFLLSLSEYGYFNPENFSSFGGSLSYFSYNGRRVSRFNGMVSDHLTRTTDAGGNRFGIILEDGTYTVGGEKTVVGIRPAFTLPNDFDVTVGVPNTENTGATAEGISHDKN